MSEHKKRADQRAKMEKPINFTCGVCGKVHPYNKGYKCPMEEEEVDEPEEE